MFTVQVRLGIQITLNEWSLAARSDSVAHLIDPPYLVRLGPVVCRATTLRRL